MSLVGSYIKCEDGYIYRDLVYRDKAGDWFICFDDEEPIELVAKLSANIDPLKVLNDLGIPFTEIWNTNEKGCSRIFDKKFYLTESWFMDAHPKAFPTPRPWDEHDGTVENTLNQGIYYGFDQPIL